MTAPEPTPELTEQDGPIVRDKRRIDPTTGQVRVHAEPQPAPGAAAPAAPEPGPESEVEAQLAERTADLQRVTAEFANYRKRVERDRQAVAEQALASVLIGVLPVLDDIDRARDHGEVEGGFKSVADNLETTLTKLGLLRYGEVGEPFDPTVHEALTHGYSSDVREPTCTAVLQPGYRIGERVLRPARVAVTEPGEPVSTPEDNE
ncbi:MAG: nucleotide exchange factor GrpE [Actinomycetes bacterium]